MRFILRLPQGGPLGTISAQDIGRVCEAVDSLGLWGISVNDNLPSWSINDWRHYPSTGVSLATDSPELKHANYYDPLGTLAFAAGVTERVKLISCVLGLPMYHPILIAKWAASIDQLSGGRLILGVGIGGGSNEKYDNMRAPCGPDLAIPKIRGEITDEYILALKELWTKDAATFEGKYCSFSKIESYPKCLQKPHVPLWTAGWKTRSCKRTAQLGDGIIPNMASPDEVRGLKTKIRQFAEKAGRSSVDFKVLCATWARVTENREPLTSVDRIMVEKSMIERYGSGKDENRLLIGSVRDIIDRVETFRDAGAFGFELRVIYRNVNDLLEQAQHFAEIQKTLL